MPLRGLLITATAGAVRQATCAFMVIHALLRTLVLPISGLGLADSVVIRAGTLLAYRSVYRFAAVDSVDPHCKELRHEPS